MVYFWCNNMVVVRVMTSCLPSQPGLIRKFMVDCLQFNILVLARHVPGMDNGIADALSHLQMQQFREL